MEEVDLHVNSYTLSELLGFFSIHSNSSEQELANSYSEKKKQAVNISDRHHRVLFETFLNDAFDVVRESLEIPQKEIKLPKRINSTPLPSKATKKEILLNIDSTFRKDKATLSTSEAMNFSPPTLITSPNLPLTLYNSFFCSTTSFVLYQPSSSKGEGAFK